MLGSGGVLKCEKKVKCGNIFLTRLRVANGLESGLSHVNFKLFQYSYNKMRRHMNTISGT